nr:MAG TPA: hypothetical protein [Caudoviricetes sp.]
MPPLVLKRLDFGHVPVKFCRALAVPQNTAWLQHFQRLAAVFGKAFCFVRVRLCAVARNAHDGVSGLTIKAPVIALLAAPAERWNDVDAVRLPVCSQPVLFVVHEKLHCKRHIAVKRKIRRTYRAELLQKRDILVRVVPEPFKLVIVLVKMHAFCGLVFGRQRIIDRDPFQLVNADVRFRLDFRDAILAHARKNHLFGVFHRQDHSSSLLSLAFFRPPHLLFLFAALGFIPLGVIHDGDGLFGHIVPLHGVLPGILAQGRGQHTAAVVDHLRRCAGVAGALNLVAHDLERFVKLCRLLVKQAVHLTGTVVVGGVPPLFDLDAQSLSVSHLLQSPGVLGAGKGRDGVVHGPVDLCISHAVDGLHGDVVDALALHDALHDVAVEHPGVIGAVAFALDALVWHHAGVVLQQELDRLGVVQGQPERHACGLFQLVERPVCAKGKDVVLLVPGQLVGRLLGCGAGLRDAVQLGVHQIGLKDLILQPDSVIVLGDLACVQLCPLALVQRFVLCKKLGQLLLHLPAGSAVHPEDAAAQAVQLAGRDAVTVRNHVSSPLFSPSPTVSRAALSAISAALACSFCSGVRFGSRPMAMSCPMMAASEITMLTCSAVLVILLRLNVGMALSNPASAQICRMNGLT